MQMFVKRCVGNRLDSLSLYGRHSPTSSSHTRMMDALIFDLSLCHYFAMNPSLSDTRLETYRQLQIHWQEIPT